MKKTLAIVIPAYKIQYLNDTLESLVNQTCLRFNVYIGDDCSPNPIRDIVEPFFNRIEVSYIRFDTNLGGRSLVQQWYRCVNLTFEDYIWLFSDDDVLPNDAVERFWQFEEEHRGNFDICRFQLDFIDGQSKHMLTLGRHPLWQSASDFLKERLLGTTLSAASEYVFTRRAYLQYGFVEFPVAWCSDDASWVQMGEKRGLFTIEGAPVLMRMSGDNISSSNFQTEQRFEAVIQFLQWISPRYNIDQSTLTEYIRTQIVILNVHFITRCKLLKCTCITNLSKLSLLLNNNIFYKVLTRFLSMRK